MVRCCPWELCWGFSRAAVFQKKLLAGWIFSFSRPFIPWLTGIISGQTAQASQRIACLSAHMPCQATLLSVHQALTSWAMMLLGATLFPGELGEPGKRRGG